MELTKGYIGEITEIDPQKMQAKMVVYGTEDITTDWLMIQSNNNFFHMPAVGDQAIAWMDEHFDDGVIVGYVNNTVPYADGKTIGLKFPGIEIEIGVESGATRIKLAGNADIEAPAFNFKGDVNVDGKLAVTGDSDLKGKLAVTKDIAGQGKIDALGIIKSTTDLQTPTFKAMLHTHVSAAPGSPTSPPVPS